jgi:SAM-dependent methyltransferase
VKGITDLRRSPDEETLLDPDAYEATNEVTLERSSHTAHVYEALLDQEYGADRTFADVLEIGSGGGNLTYGLALSDRFGQVHCSDVSPRFMKILQSRMHDFGVDEKLSYYLFDANELPFPDGRFDLVVGHSVLHHFARFEDTIASACRILRAGGCAIFGEPVLDSFAFVSLAARLIRDTHDRAEVSRAGRRPRFRPRSRRDVLDDPKRRRLDEIANLTSSRTQNLRGDRDNLSNIEDKFIVSVSHMKTLGIRAGFSKVTFSDGNSAPIDLGETIYRCLTDEYGADVQQVDEYRYILDAIQDVYGDPMRDSLTPLFGYYVLVK